MREDSIEKETVGNESVGQDVMEMVFILDCSGSMYKKESAMIQGFCMLLEEQRKQEKVHPDNIFLVTTALFSDECEILYHEIPVREVPDLTKKNYFVRGNTALYDAMGKVFSSVGEEKRGMAFILTDGVENASVHYSKEKVGNLIEEKQREGWTILFFGTNLEALDFAKDIGIKEKNVIAYTDNCEGIIFSYEHAKNKFSEMVDMM